jgi:hypothetical protein
MKSMCCLCIQFTHENTSERTILHLVKKKILGLVACTAKKASYALDTPFIPKFLFTYLFSKTFLHNRIFTYLTELGKRGNNSML